MSYCSYLLIRQCVLPLALGLTALLAVPNLNAEPLQEVTYLLPAPSTLTAFAPWMLAQHKGYYTEEGLNVRFITARGGVDVAKQVGAGNALIGGAIGDTPIIVRANGIPVKAVAVLGAGSLTVIVAKKDSGIKNVADLKGKTVTVLAYSDTTYYAFLGSLEMAGMNRRDLDIQAAGAAGIWQLFSSGRSDAMAGVPGWIANVEQAGSEVHILPREQTFQSMAQAIVASDKVIKENPELIAKLVRATLRGMQDIIDDPSAAVTAYIEAVPAYRGQDALIERTFDLYREYVYTNQKVLGFIDKDRLSAVQDFYVSQGIVSKAQDLEDLYTNQFIEAR